jgi:hypothetical protein
MKARTSLPSSAKAIAPKHEVQGAARGATRWLIILTVLMVGTWLVGGAFLLQHGFPWSAGSGAAPDVPAAEEKPAHKSLETAQGAWGQLEIVPITITPPLELVPEYAPFTSHKVEWHFSGTSSSRLATLLAEIGLPESLRTTLLSLAKLNPAVNGFTIQPGRELVLGLSPEDRGKLYIALGTFLENADQVKAFRFRGDSPEEWFKNSTVSAETRKLVMPLIYRYGSFLFFADLRSIEESLPSPEERLALLKTLSREATYLVKIRVTPEADIEALVNYWGRNGRAKEVRPILEALASVEGGESSSIRALLPPFARQRLLTYPDPPEKGPAVNHDCHWSSFNFFSEEPDDRFCDETEIARTLDREYYRVYGNFQLGDLVLFFGNENSFLHSAVFLADDILFTKNGNLSSRPWMLMKLEDMKTFYPTLKPVDVRFYRRKDI